MKIVVDRSYPAIDGILTSMVDIYYNFRKFGIESNLVISTQYLENDILRIPSNFQDKSFYKCLTNKIDIEDDIIITSAYTVFNKRLKLHTNKLIILDCWHSMIYKDIKADIYLTNPANKRPDTLTYYHKFNEDRLKMLKLSLKESYSYNRTMKKNALFNDIYLENIGKRIFEYAYHNRTVHYSPKGLKINDGLCYYLRLFDIDPYMNHSPLLITKEDIKDKLIMKEDDLLIKCIS